MSPLTTIPARITVTELARVCSVDVEKAQAVLVARSEPDAPGELLGPDVSVAVARTLGKQVTIEPRDLALEILYEIDTSGLDPDGGSGRTKRLVQGVLEKRQALDKSIEEASEHWSVARMPIVDRAILRIALYELLEEEVPTAVIISEAVKLAGIYSTERSGSFINGVLATLAREVRS